MPEASDIKIMLPREWEPALLKAMANAGERTLTAYVKGLVEDQLDLSNDDTAEPQSVEG